MEPNAPSDANKDLNGDGVTNLEKYLDGIDPTKKIDYRKPENTPDPLTPASLAQRAPKAAKAAPPMFVAQGKDGRLVYESDARGNRVPDFSHAGYGGGGVAIPEAPVKVRVPAAAGDATARIQ